MSNCPKTDLVELYRVLASAIVANPNRLSVRGVALPSSTSIVVRAEDSDQGKLLGSSRVTLNAFEKLLRVVAQKQGCIVHLVIESPWPGTTAGGSAFRPRGGWTRKDNDRLKALVLRMFDAVLDHPASISYSDISQSASIFAAECVKEAALADHVLVSAIETIAHAIGKTMGRVVYLDIVTKERKESHESITPPLAGPHTRD